MTRLEDRQTLLHAIEEARAAGWLCYRILAQ
jgi:hypothetical protein